MNTEQTGTGIKIKNEQGESRVYLGEVHVGRIYTWCPPASEMNRGVGRIAKVTLLDGRTFDFPGMYRNDLVKWVKTGEWIAK